jgi:hypothetical protein
MKVEMTLEAAERGVTESPRPSEDIQVLIREVRHQARRRRLRWSAAIALPAALVAAILVFSQTTHGGHSPDLSTGSFGESVALSSACRSGNRSLPTHAIHSSSIRAFGPGSIAVQLVLCQSSVVAGDPLKAVLVFENHTHRTLATHECPDQWLLAGVVGEGFSSVPAVADDLCVSNGPPYIPSGRWYLSTQIPTFSSSCNARATTTESGIPPCTAVGGWLPSLPRGRYHTYVQILGVPLRSSVLPAQGVTLVTCRSNKACACAPLGDRPFRDSWVPFC